MCTVLVVVVIILVFCTIALAMESGDNDDLFDMTPDELEAILAGAWHFATPLLSPTVDALERIITQNGADMVREPAPSAPIEAEWAKCQQYWESLKPCDTIAWTGAQFLDGIEHVQLDAQQSIRPNVEDEQGSDRLPMFTQPFPTTEDPDFGLTSLTIPTEHHHNPSSANEQSILRSATSLWSQSDATSAHAYQDLTSLHSTGMPRAARSPCSERVSMPAANGQASRHRHGRPQSEPAAQRCLVHCPHPGCSRSFRKLTDLKHHQRYHRPMQARPFGCSLCPRRFNFPRELTRHMSRHGKQYCLERHFCPFVECAYATNGFSRKDNLERHISTQHQKLTTTAMSNSSVKMEEADVVDPMIWL